MRVGMTLPTMVRGVDGPTLVEWARRIDGGPFSSLAVGERISYHNPDLCTTLAAAAAVTSRVRLISSLVVLPLHQAAMVAKQLASIDLLSGGRLTVGVGVGARDDDYCAAGVSTGDRLRSLDEGVDVLRSIWRQEIQDGSSAPIGPPPVQVGGPPIWIGATGPKALTRAARWADGVMAFWFDPTPAKATGALRRARDRWAEAADHTAEDAIAPRSRTPQFAVTFWYATGDEGADQLRAYAKPYLSLFGEEVAASMISAITATSTAALRDLIGGLSEVGVGEVLLIPTTDDLADLDRVEDVLVGLGCEDPSQDLTQREISW